MTLFGLDTPPTRKPRTWTVLRPVDPEVLQRMLLYESKKAYYMLGYYGEETRCRLLTFPKTQEQHPKRLHVAEDERTYTPTEVESLFQRKHADPNEEGLQLLCEAFGILGCFRFLEGYYLLLITKRKALGSLAGHTVYGVADTTLIPLSGGGCPDSYAERRYRKLLLSGVDLTKDFFFSYTYHVSHTVQHNLTHTERADPFECIFVWNEYLTRDLRHELRDNKWLLPLVHGSWQQRNLSIFGKIVQLTLIARRSRRFAGTRYLKRGINQFGWVANEVETEQIVSLQNLTHSGIPSLASVVQLRGSIPLFWGQGTSALNPRPNIQLYNIDPLYEATRKHFEDLFARYGAPVVVMNLVKSQERQPRETILRKEFSRAISFLNKHYYGEDIVYVPWDFKANVRKDERCLLKEAEPMMRSFVEYTGFCMISPAMTQSVQKAEPQLQEGILRCNCIDCLDRTNISQYMYGLTALGYQLCSLGLLASNELDPDCSMAYQLMQMYEIMGNVLALQYGGSEAHGTFFERMRGDSGAATQSRELLRSIKRYYSNAVSDPEKQDAINLFLGHFIPQHDKANIWELESDYLLHCGVDWEQQLQNFALRPSASLGTRPSIINDNFMAKASLKASQIEFFPVPVISRTGDPESKLASEQTSKESSSGWSLNFWFRSTQEEKEFQLPASKAPVLDSFEELLAVNPVIEVRLHDGVNRRQRGGSRLAFQKTLARLQRQEAMTDPGSMGPCGMENERFSDSFLVGRSPSSSTSMRASSAIQSLRSRPSKLTALSDRPSRSKKCTTQEFGSSLPSDSTFGLVEKGQRVTPDTEMSPLQRRSWFSGLRRRSGEPPACDKPSNQTHRSLSTPADVEKGGIHRLGQSISMRAAFSARTDPVEEFWDEYWSITEQSLASELTLAEKISKSNNKREAERLARAPNALNGKSTSNDVGRMSAANVFLDNLLHQCLDHQRPHPQRPPPPPTSERKLLTEQRMMRGSGGNKDGAKSDGDEGTTLDVPSNINALLFASASGPGDRVLEKWFRADQQAEADYYQNLAWIVTNVDSLAITPEVIQA